MDQGIPKSLMYAIAVVVGLVVSCVCLVVMISVIPTLPEFDLLSDSGSAADEQPAGDVQAPPPAASPTPDGLVLFDDFSSVNSGWPQAEDENSIYAYLNGSYRIMVLIDNHFLWTTGGYSLTDTRVEVDVTKTGGPVNSDMGLICRYQDRTNFYFFFIAADGYYAVYKYRDGVDQIIGMEDYQYSEAIHQGNVTNHMRADCVGNTLTLSINGQILAAVQDNDLPKGDVGMIAGSFDNVGADILFDNFTVYDLAP